MSNVAVVRSGTATDGLTAGQSKGVRATPRDIGGGFGDAPLLIPLAVALVTINHRNATAVLVGAGVLYITVAYLHRLPIPVQPLKAVSAIAISAGLGPSGIVAACLMIGALFVELCLSGLADRPVIGMTVACVGRPWCSRCPGAPRHAGTASTQSGRHCLMHSAFCAGLLVSDPPSPRPD